MLDLRPFQRKFLRESLKPDIDTAALSLPRGNGKSSLAAHILTRVLDPSDKLFTPGTESVLCAASIEQARIVHRFARADLEGRNGYRFLDSHTRIGITHVPTNTRLRVIGSNGRTAMGLVGCPWAVCDEPGAWEVNGGTLLHDAIETAKGKPGSPLRVIYIGTLAPAMSGWWHDLVEDGSHGTVHVCQRRRDHVPVRRRKIVPRASAVACPRSPREGPARGATRPPRGWRRPARGWGLWAHAVKRGVIRTEAGVGTCSA